MTTPVECIAKILWAALRAQESPAVHYDAVLALVNERLPKLLEAMAAGLVTGHEVAGAITARFETWLEQRTGQEVERGAAWWDPVVQDIEKVLSSA
jgi:hypothetical protein